MFAITDRQAIAEAYERFARLIYEGGAPVQRMVGHKGASTLADLLWHKDLGLWVLLQAERIKARY